MKASGIHTDVLFQALPVKLIFNWYAIGLQALLIGLDAERSKNKGTDPQIRGWSPQKVILIFAGWDFSLSGLLPLFRELFQIEWNAPETQLKTSLAIPFLAPDGYQPLSNTWFSAGDNHAPRLAPSCVSVSPASSSERAKWWFLQLYCIQLL